MFLAKVWGWITGKPHDASKKNDDASATQSNLRKVKTGPENVITMKSTSHWKEHLDMSSESKPLVVDFTATWCGPCKRIAPFYAELSAKYPEAIFVKVDVDELDDVMSSCGVRAMPTFQVYKNGKKADELVGADGSKLEAMVARHVN